MVVGNRSRRRRPQVFGNNLSAKDLKPVFDTAMKNGLNLWDTATVYGMGSSESILASFVKQCPREQVAISTKFTPQITPDSPGAVEEMLDASLKRFETDYVDIYWIHNPADVERWTPGLIPLLKKGKVKRVGVSNHNLAGIETQQKRYFLPKDSIFQPYRTITASFIAPRKMRGLSIIAIGMA